MQWVYNLHKDLEDEDGRGGDNDDDEHDGTFAFDLSLAGQIALIANQKKRNRPCAVPSIAVLQEFGQPHRAHRFETLGCGEIKNENDGMASFVVACRLRAILFAASGIPGGTRRWGDGDARTELYDFKKILKLVRTIFATEWLSIPL